MNIIDLPTSWGELGSIVLDAYRRVALSVLDVDSVADRLILAVALTVLLALAGSMFSGLGGDADGPLLSEEDRAAVPSTVRTNLHIDPLHQ